MPSSGYQEFAHTADWGIHVWAEDIVSLLVTAAKGMFGLLEIAADGQDLRAVTFELPIPGSLEMLVVDFLNELLFLSEREQIGFERLDVEISDNQLQASLTGGVLVSQNKEIKAVTYHKLVVERIEQGYEVNIIFDV